jgi:hypothetical protein
MKIFAKIVRIIAIVFLAITALFTLMGGAGTICATLWPDNPDWADTLGPLIDYQGVYGIFMLVTLAIGAVMVYATVLLILRKPRAYWWALGSLIAGIAIGILHMNVSRQLRGSSMPVDMVVYTTILTLILFLILRLPPIWKQLSWNGKVDGQEKQSTGGAALIAAGILTLTIQYWMSATHTFSGTNFADSWHTELTLLGCMMLLVGLSWTIISLCRNNLAINLETASQR